MAEIKAYIDKQLILSDIASDMLSMTGWSDTYLTKYCTRNKDSDKLVPVDLKLDSDSYVCYFGDEDVTVAISNYRNITVVCNLKTFEIEGSDKYDYFVRTYHLSSILTEVNLASIDLTVHKLNEDWLYFKWEFLDHTFEAYISTYI